MSLTPRWTSASPSTEPSPEPRGRGARRPGFSPDHPPPGLRARAVAFVASLLLTAPVWGATAASAAMTVTLVGASAGQTVTGGLALEARASGGTPTRIEFTVDGALLATERIAPYCMGGDGGALPCNAWDSRRVANGQRTIRATAYDAAGGSASASVTVTVSNTTSSPAPSGSTSLSHLRAFDIVRGIRYIYDAALREKAWQWAAAKLDGLEADGSFSSEMVKRDGSIHPVSYRLDLTACQHQGCRSTWAVDTTVASLPESYYLHFSETTTLQFKKPDGTLVKQVTIPGCPSGTPISKSCRVQLWLWDDARWAFNVNDPGFQNWQANRLLASLGNGQKGMFLDEHAANIMDAWRWGRETKAVSGGGVRELGGNRPSYGTATTLYQTMVVNWMAVFRTKAKAAGKYLMPNLSLEATDAWGIKEALAAGGVSIEFLHRPDAFDGASGHFERYIQLIKDLVAIGGVADLAGTLCYYGPSGYTAGNYGSPKTRYWMWRLAAYYLVREPAGSAARIYFNPTLCTKNWPTDPLGWTKEWLPAYEKSVGSPSGDAYKIKSGSYSSGTKTCGYRVFARNYTGGMVLVRTKDAWNCTDWGDGSAQTVSLPRSLRVLKEDGTLGTATSTVRLRNGEALVLKNL